MSYTNPTIRCAIGENFHKHVYAKKSFKKLDDHVLHKTEDIDDKITGLNRYRQF